MQTSCKGSGLLVWYQSLHRQNGQIVCAMPGTYQVANTKETLIPHDVPKHAWHTLATDLLHWNGTEYMLIADFYSKFPIIQKLTNKSSSTTINHLKGIFDEHGIPERLISDNGPQYSSKEFRVFSAKYGFDYVKSSPLYPRSNGLIGRTVQIVKKLFTKLKEGGVESYSENVGPGQGHKQSKHAEIVQHPDRTRNRVHTQSSALA